MSAGNSGVRHPLDTTLAQAAQYGPWYGPGFSDHGPMVVESLAHAGRVDAIEPWFARYSQQLDLLDPATQLDEAILGNERSFLAWTRRAAADIDRDGWRQTVDRWMGDMVASVIGEAGHGTLRVSHAVRGLLAAETPERLAELSRALAVMAIGSTRLPGDPRPSGVSSVDEAMAALPTVDVPQGGFITTGLAALADVEHEFSAAVDSLDPAQLDVSTIVAAVSRVVVSHEVPWIVHTHAITVPVCLRVLAPVVSPAVAADLLRHGWQAVAGLMAAFPPGAPRTGRSALDPDELLDLALRSGDDHHIKLAVAAGCEVAAGGDPVVLAAAHTLITTL